MWLTGLKVPTNSLSSTNSGCAANRLVSLPKTACTGVVVVERLIEIVETDDTVKKFQSINFYGLGLY